MRRFLWLSLGALLVASIAVASSGGATQAEALVVGLTRTGGQTRDAGDNEVYSAVFSPDGKSVLTASMDGTAAIWDASAGRRVRTLKGHTDWVNEATFSPDGRRIVTASTDKTARIWDARSGRTLVVLRGHKGGVGVAVFSPDGKRILTGSSDGTARIWDARSGRLLHTLRQGRSSIGEPLEVYDAAFSPDGTLLATAGGAAPGVEGKEEGVARIWDARSGRLLYKLRVVKSQVVGGVEFSPNGRLLVTAAGEPRLWNMATGRLVRPLKGHRGWISNAQFSPDGRRLVTGSVDDTARIWDVASGRTLHVLKGHRDLVDTAEFDPRGTRIVTGSWDGTARIWDVASGRILHVLRH